MTRERIADGLRIEVFSDLTRVETLWRALESAPGAVATPYQRFDWVAAYVEAEIAGAADRPAPGVRVMVLRDAADRPRALLPLEVARECGVRVARVIGERHANFHMPLFASREALALSPDDLERALVTAGGQAGIDLYALDHQPRSWDGAANPLGAAGLRCASDAYGLRLGPDPDATLRRAYSGDARKKLRAKERKLVEALGPVAHRVARTPEAVRAMLEAFYAQKRARMAQLGVPDVYAREATRRFLARAAEGRAAGGGASAIEIHALVAERDERILATFGGAVDAARFSGMWTSFDTDPALGRYSPGDLLLHHLVAHQSAAGRRALDLGVGEARYKASICDETIELVQTFVPVTVRGRAYGLALMGAARLKRTIKRSPGLWAAARSLRRLHAA